MASFNNFVLLILLLITIILVSDASQERQATLSEEEKTELKRQLKTINKPAIKSFKTKHGDIFDCIDIHKQLAFDHHLLKNHTVQLEPTTLPEWITNNNISDKADPLQFLQEDITCPDGTVIVKRTTMQELINAQRLRSAGFNGPKHFITERNNNDVTGKYYAASVEYGPSSFTGVKGKLNLWDTQVSPDQYTLSYIAVAGGAQERFSTIFVGWMVNPSRYHMAEDHVRLYTFWSGHNNPGCYDMTCPGFVQVSKKIPPGVFVTPASIYNGDQYELNLTLYQDRAKGDWWFAFNSENVGYWPATLFIPEGLAKRAEYASWGGQAYSPSTEKSPVMGSGHWPSEGFGKAAYVNDIKIIDGSGKVLDPESGRMKTRETDSKCYKAVYVHEDKEPWLRAVYYGGPGGCIGN
ncbi:unnamed protein product [Cochlearia groenlandica]